MKTLHLVSLEFRFVDTRLNIIRVSWVNDFLNSYLSVVFPCAAMSLACPCPGVDLDFVMQRRMGVNL